MLRSQDSIAIRASLDELVKKATKIKLDNYEPTISEIEKINKDIYEFIKKNKLIIYGGFAQNYLIGKKDSKDMFYDRLSLADVEFYHYDPIGIGNTFICESAYGRLFEVTPEGDVVWEYVIPDFAEYPEPLNKFITGMHNSCFKAHRYPERSL